MSRNVIQSSFASGELSPTLYARVDLTKYHSGAALMRNFFVDYRSGASTRTGTKFVVQAFDSTKPVRLIPFQTSVLVPYILEFGDFYVRPSTMGTPVQEASFAITNITQANPAAVTAPGNTFNVGDVVFITGVGGMVQVSGRYFKVLAAGATFTIADVNGVPISSLGYSAYTSGGTVARLYKFASPYAAADLALLKFVQVANVMYLTHPSYPPTVLTFVSPTNWTFTTIAFGTTAAKPTGITATPSTVGAVNYSYTVTSVDAAGQESLNGTPGATASVNIGTTAGTIRVTYAAAAGATAYNIYKAEPSYSGAVPTGAAFGFIGSATGTTFDDTNIVPDFATTPPIPENPFAAANNPGVSCFFQQRLYYFGSNAFPQTFWASQPGLYNNFNLSDPIQADDAITGTLVSLQVNFIKAAVPLPGGLIILTAKGAWQLSSGGGFGATAAVTPIDANAVPQAYNGISDVPPIIAVQDILYVQAKGSIVRNLTYNIYANIYTGNDVSILSNHLFYGFRINEWAWAEEPFKVIWAVRSDGILLSLTWVKEQEIQGWAESDTLGLFKSVATVTEGEVDAIYVVVQRYIGGRWVQMIERMANRTFTYGPEDAWCVDCGSISDSNTNHAETLTASASTGTGVTFTANGGIFNATNVGQIIRMGGGIATVTAFVSPFQLVGTITQPITDTLPNDPNLAPIPAAPGTWSITPQFTTFFGLDYLEGQTVSILADGNVVTPQVVTGGAITLAKPASKVVVGLAFVAQLKTMYLDLGDERDSIQGKRKKISALTLRVNETRGLSYGQSFDRLSPIKEFSQDLILGQTIPLVSSDEYVIMDPLWDVPGQICIQQDNPLPATVLGVVPEISVGDK